MAGSEKERFTKECWPGYGQKEEKPETDKMKLAGGALQLTLVIALTVLSFCAALIGIHALSKLSYQKAMRLESLDQLVQNGIVLGLSSDTSVWKGNQPYFLYSDRDTLKTETSFWGCFRQVNLQAFHGSDTIKKCFFSAIQPADSLKVLYVPDEDRPVSVSGETRIIGDVEIPKAGIKSAYIDGKAYKGKRIVNGRTLFSKTKMPELDSATFLSPFIWLDTLQREKISAEWTGSINDTISRSFFKQALVIYHKEKWKTGNMHASGKVILLSDSLITISEEAKLEHVIVIAPEIHIENNFSGTLQAFATHNILVGKGVKLNYPSVFVLVKKDESLLENGNKIELGEDSFLQGNIITYDPLQSEIKTQVKLDKKSSVNGEIYADGYLLHAGGNNITGSLICKRFLYKSSSSIYENYIVDLVLDRKSRSPFFLSAVKTGKKPVKRKVLCWLK